MHRQRRDRGVHGLDVRRTCSLGVATSPDHAQCSLDLIRAADFAMYEVKAQGRDGVRVAQPLPPEMAQPAEPTPSGADVTG